MWIRWRWIKIEGAYDWSYLEMPDEMENRSEEDVLQYLNDDGIHPNYWTGTTHLSGFEWEKVSELPIEQIQGQLVDLHRTYKESGYGNDLERYEKMLAEVQQRQPK